MLTVHALVHLALLAVWFLAASVGGTGMWLRWPVLGVACLLTLATRVAPSRRARVAAVALPTAALVAYGLLLAPAARAPGMALAKAAAFGATTFACLGGGTTLVERLGRDGVLAGWHRFASVALVVAAAAAAAGVWHRGPEGLYGPTGNPNMFGSIVLSIGMVLALPRPPGRRELRLLAIVAGSALLLATRSRASIAAAAAGAAVALLLHRGRARFAWAAALVVVTGAFLVARPSDSVRGVASVTEGTTLHEMAATRLRNWEDSWTAMLDGLPLGLGWGVKAGAVPVWTFDVKTLGYGREEGTSWLPVGEELGFPGLALVVAVWVVAVRSLRRAPHGPQTVGGVALAAWFVLATFEGWFLSPGNWESAAFWTTLGIVLARPRPAAFPVAPADERVARPALATVSP